MTELHELSALELDVSERWLELRVPGHELLRAALPHQVVLDITLIDDSPVRIDVVQMEQVLLNMVRNASQAMAGRRGSVGVEVEPSARRNIVTRGVALNHLVGRTFRVGTAVVRDGISTAPTCAPVRLSTVPYPAPA